MKKSNTPPHYNPRGNSIQINFRHNGVRHRKQFPTREAAERYHAETLASPPDAKPARPSDGPRSPGSEPTLSWMLDYAIDKHWKGKPSARTAIANAKQCVNILGPTRRVSSIDEADIESLVSALWRSGVSGSTINCKLACLSIMLRLAYERGWIKQQPDVRPRFKWIQPFPYLSEDAERKFMAWAEGMGLSNLRDLVAILIDTGMEPAEAIALRDTDIGECIRFPVEGEMPERVISVSDRIRELVNRRRSSAGPSGPLFGAYGRYDAERDWSLARTALSLPPGPSFGLRCLHDTFCMRTVYRVPGLHGAFAITKATGRRGPAVMNYDDLRGQEVDGRPYPPAVGKRPKWYKPRLLLPILPTTKDTPVEKPGTAPQDDAGDLRELVRAWPRLPKGVRAGIVAMVRAMQE